MKYEKDIKRLVFYQIEQDYFRDSNKSGNGDFKGIMQLKNYFEFLKIDVVILNNLLLKYKNKNINRNFLEKENGSILDFFNLVKVLKEKKINIAIPINIKNINSVWENLQVALKLLKNEKDNKRETREIKKTKSFYSFKTNSRDISLFWRNNEVINNFIDVVNFYKDLGVKYFIFENTEFLYDLEKEKSFNENTLKQLKELKEIITKIDDSIIVIGKSHKANNGQINKMLFKEKIFDYFINQSIPFLFTKKIGNFLVKNNFSTKKFIKTIILYANSKRKILAFNNEKIGRYIERWAKSNNYSEDIAKVFGSILLLSPASPLIFYGDELATHNVPYKNLKSLKSPEYNELKRKTLDGNITEKQLNDHYQFLHSENTLSIFSLLDQKNKINSAKNPIYYPFAKHFKKFNVEREQKDTFSVLAHFLRILSLTQESIYLHVFQEGKFTINHDVLNSNIIKINWLYDNIKINLIGNLSPKPQKIHTSKNNVVFISTFFRKYYPEFPRELKGYELIIYSTENL